MTVITGTHDITTLLAARFQSAAEYGLDTIQQVLQADLVAWNMVVTEMLSDMCEITADRQRIYGTSANGQMQEVDEYGKASTEKVQPGSTVGFPLRLFQYNLGWTAKYLQTATPSDLATGSLAAQKAHMREIQRQIKKAMYLNTNYSFRDHLVDNIDLAIKRFINADGAPIPDGPNGEVFVPATHEHYAAEASLTAAFLTALINNVIEHGYGSDVRVAFNKTDEAAVRALTGFVAYPDPRLAASSFASSAGTPVMTLDISRLDNRAIGVFAGAEVWIKSWAIASYPFVWDAGATDKPMAFRQREQSTLQGLRLAANIPDHPLYVDFMEAEFGIGVWTRSNGAVLYFDNATWTDPTIT